MDINGIVTEYESFDITQGIDRLLLMKKNLSILIYKCSKYVASLEEQSKNLYAERKISLAVSELEIEGTGQHRKNQAIVNNMDLINKEAEIEGKLKAYKIKYDGMIQLSNSMASYLGKM